MVKNDKKPRLRFKGFTDEWEQRKLGEIYKFEYGEFNNNPDNAGKFPIYGANGVIGGYTRYNAENSIIIGHMGEYAGSVIYEKGKHFVTYNGTITTLLDNSNVTFYDYSLLSNLNIRKICTSSGLPFLSYDMLNTIKAYSTINKNEQIKISNFFESLDNLITLHQRKYDKLLNVKKALLDKMFPKNQEKTPKIRFKGFFDTWEQRKLGEIAQITMGQSPDGSTYSDKPLDYILVQGNADLVDGWVYPRIWTSQKTKTCQVGDLIMSVRAPAGSVGKTLYNAVIGRGVAAIKGNEFLFQNLVKMDNNSYWKLLSCGSTFESLNSDNIKNAKIKIPSEIEQTKIGDFFYNLDNLITLHQSKCEKLKNIKKALLDKMFV